MRSELNSFHLVDPSPWPLVTSTSILMSATGAVMYFHGYGGSVLWLLVGFLFLTVSIYYWLRDVIREGTYEGQHVSIVQKGFRFGFMLFIISEVMFFFGFFFGYFWLSFGGAVEAGGVFPPVGIVPISSGEIPLLNTLILLSSGASITWAHHGMISGSRRETILGLIVTIVLAVLFTSLQGYEYLHGSFNISDGLYGSTFYMLTGFHGLHVIVGTIMIIVTFVRVIGYEQTREHHFNLELAAIYWHFVDVVWLFLFVALYIWGC